jgi:hypothetical protein
MKAHSKPTGVDSERDDNNLVKAGHGVLLDGGYPNPDRVGCPGAEALKALARRKMDSRESEASVLHISSCSPCFKEYIAFQKQGARRKTLQRVLATAALATLAVLAGWLLKTGWFIGSGGGRNVIAVTPQKVTLDLRNRVVFRNGESPSANSGPIQLGRGRLDVTMLLSVGSKLGNYEVQVSREPQKPLITASGVAVNQNGISMLTVKLDLSKLSPGTYILAIDGVDAGRREYPLDVN